jgi:hypothetical protein
MYTLCALALMQASKKGIQIAEMHNSIKGNGLEEKAKMH